jgi:alpha-tubulin suppressor-like RCC1 family protein
MGCLKTLGRSLPLGTLIAPAVVFGLVGLFAETAVAQVGRPGPLERTYYKESPRVIGLKWEDKSNNETHFLVEASDDGGRTWAPLGQVAADVTTFEGALPAGRSMLYFRVSAIASGVSSAASNIISVEGTNPVRSDTDQDGMTDWLELKYGLDPYYDDAYEDADGDRFPNVFECVRNSDPRDPNDKPPSDFVVDAGGGQVGNVCPSLQEALNKVGTGYRIILVRDGIYSGSGNINVTMSGSYPVMVLGEHGARDTVFDAGTKGRIAHITGNILFDGVTFRGGRTTEGGALFSSGGDLFVVNCVFSGNYAFQTGGAIYQDSGRTLVIHSTFFDNRTDVVGATVYVKSGDFSAAKSIFWNPKAGVELGCGTDASVDITDSIVREGYPGSGNFSADPLLRFDGHLFANSPAIERGSVLMTTLWDMDGEERPVGSTTDIGADEWCDSDNDSLPDWWELYYLGSLAEGPGEDDDNDKLSNAREYSLGLAPQSSDSDSDGLPDDWELEHNLNPRSPDSAGDPDWDGYTNLAEYQQGLDPHVRNFQVRLAGGWGHTLILRADGKVWSVGCNSNGQLGDGTKIERNSAVEVQNLDDVVAIAAGARHSVALTRSSALWTWGEGKDSQLGNRSRFDSAIPVRVAGQDFVQVSAGDVHSLALKKDGSVWAWGQNTYGQLGTGGTHLRRTPGMVERVGGDLLKDVVAISAGHSFSMALKKDGTIVSWGRNDHGQLGDGTTIDRHTPVVVNGRGYVAIAAGAAHSLALKSDGTVEGWGSNSVGQLGRPASAVPGTLPAKVSGADYKGIAAGDSHSLLLKKDGTVDSMGYNRNGQLGHGGTATHWAVSPVDGLTSVAQIFAGPVSNHSLAVREDGSLVLWGDNRTNQLGDRPSLGHVSPLVVSSLDAVENVSLSKDGAQFALALKKDGSVWAWGRNDSGQLGDNTLRDAFLPRKVGGEEGAGHLTGIVQLSAADRFSVARKMDGTLRAWGFGELGSLGRGSFESSAVPLTTGPPDAASCDVAAGGLSAAMIQNDGTVWTWGDNRWGQLGDGSTTNRNTPGAVLDWNSTGFLSNVEQIGMGSGHVLARKSDGTVWAWGLNDRGQLGDGTFTHRTVPVQVVGLSGTGSLSGITKIVSGGFRNLAFQNDGALWSWGQSSPKPSRIPGPSGQGYLEGVVDGDIGQNHVALKKADGTVWTFGLNWGGQLGNGTMVDSPAHPVQVAGLRGVTKVFAGQGSTMALKEDGTLFAWGESRGNEIAVGITDHVVTARPLAGLHGWHTGPQVKLEVSGSSMALIGSPIPVHASITAGSGEIRKVEFFNERIKIGETTSAPWSFDFIPATWGTYHLTGVATDVHGNQSVRSGAVAVEVPYDGDGDGLPDWWEKEKLDALTAGAGDDSDEDGLLNGEEFAKRTNPQLPDTDADGIPDGWEVAHGLDPLVDDSTGNPDGDKLPNLQEYLLGLNPNKADVQPAIQTGETHLVLLRADGTVWTWGGNDAGQLGNGTMESHRESRVPVQVSGLTDVVEIAAGVRHNLALKSDGTVWAWGDGSSGQLGDGQWSVSDIPVQVAGLDEIIGIAAGNGFSLALKTDGTVRGWGSNWTCQLGDGSWRDAGQPQEIPNLTQVQSISAGGDFGLALREDGSVWGWGANWCGQLGDGTMIGRDTPVQVAGNLTGLRKISAGFAHALALRNDDTIIGWGANWDGALGSDETSSFLEPIAVGAITNVSDISAGQGHNLAIRSDGTVYAWGSNAAGQLGNGTLSYDPVLRPEQISGLTGVISISASIQPFSAAIGPGGEIWVWGSNWFGELADGIPVESSRPIELGIPNTAMSVSAGNTEALLLRGDGTVWTWGGLDENSMAKSTFVQAVGLSGVTVTKLASGGAHHFALSNDGVALAWGANYSGQLGDGTTTPSTVPVEVPGMTAADAGIVKIAGGKEHSLALRRDGEIFSWGDNRHGELAGGGYTDQRESPGSVQLGPDAGPISDIAAGGDHNLAVSLEGAVWAWGRGSEGQLGPSRDESQAPHQVDDMNLAHGVIAVAAGDGHSLALKKDGRVWAWGDNEGGMLGLGTGAGTSGLPARVPGLTGVGKIAAGGDRSFALKADGSVWGWGNNEAGRLGTGDGARRNIPALIPNLSGVKELTVGSDFCVAVKYDGSVCVWGNGQYGQLANGMVTGVTEPQRVADINALHTLPKISLARAQSAIPVLPDVPVALEVSLTEGVSPIAKVEYFCEQSKFAESNEAPWGCDWTPKTWGRFDVKAVATDADGNRVTSNVLKVVASTDRDLDELPDWWELRFFGDLNQTKTADWDGDNLDNLGEFRAGTDPFNIDSDGDGENDGEEEPVAFDPMNEDSDGDGMVDGYESENGLNPLQDDALYDKDGDGVPNLWEFAKGTAAGDRSDFPAWDWVVDAANSDASISDNLVKSIGEAIDGVPDDNGKISESYRTILVKGPEHSESIVIPKNKRIALIAEKGWKPVKLTGANVDEAVLEVQGSSVVDGFWITRPANVLRSRLVTEDGVQVRLPSWQKCRIGNTMVSGQKSGSAIACRGAGSLILDHCTIFGNHSHAVWNFEGSVELEGSILWNPLGKQEILGMASATGCIIRGGSHGGIDADPLLWLDGTLSAASPARDAQTELQGSGGDIHGEGRPYGAARDIGADELVDSDDDGLADLWEIVQFSNLDESGFDDGDHDGVSNLEEFAAGSDPQKEDGDGDGLGDRAEIYEGTDPASFDSDGDDMPDGYEIANGLNALHDDGLFDLDGDGAPNLWEMARGTSPSDKNSSLPWDWIVDPEQGEVSAADNIVSTIDEALHYSGEWALVRVKAGSYFGNFEMPLPKKVALVAERQQGRRVQLVPTNGSIPIGLRGTGVMEGFDITWRWGVVQPNMPARCGMRTEGRWRLVNCFLSGYRQEDPVVDATGDLFLEHCTIAFNQGSSTYLQCERADVFLQGCILWNPLGGGMEVSQNAAVDTVGSIIRGGQYGALNADPLLWENGALHCGSPAVDLASGASAATVDIDGEFRPFGAGRDAGADELVDSDGDSLADWWELRYFEDLAAGGDDDPDGDELSNDAEFAAHSDPTQSDGDNDGFSDLYEIANGLDPFTADSDRDGMNDDYELEHGLNPRSDDADEDKDGDGLPNGFEYRSQGRLKPTVADSPDGDSDNDGISNLYEAIYGLDPASDDGSVDIDNDGLNGREEFAFGSNPLEADVDKDGLNDSQEKSLGTHPWNSDSEGEVIPGEEINPGDGLPDGWELQHGLDPLRWDDPKSDSDQDGLSLELEYRIGTNPSLADSDGDGTPDGVEVERKTSPTDASWGGTESPVETVEAAFVVGSGGKQLTQSCAVCHWLEVKIDGRLYRDGEVAVLKKGKPYDITVVDVPKPIPPNAVKPPDHPTAYTAKFTVYPQAVEGQTITEVPGGENRPPKAFFVQKDEVLQYLIDNQEGLLVKNKEWPKEPAEEPTKKKARILPVEIVTDYNRDGVIDDKDRGKVTAENPWRFWVNDDDDWDETGGDDIPDVEISTVDDMFHIGPDFVEKEDGRHGQVDGARDLVDFFPLFLDIKRLMETLSPTEYGFYLKHETGALNMVETSLFPSGTPTTNSGAYLRDLHWARELEKAESRRVTKGGIQLSYDTLSKIINGSGVVLMEAREKTTQPLVLEVRKHEGGAVASFQFPISVAGVESMFRMKNMVMEVDARNPNIPEYVEAKNLQETVPSRLSEPQNYPDELCSNDWFVFIHGCCTSQEGARGWHSEIFKRLFWSGLSAKFLGITWRGDESSGVYSPITDGTPNYHQNVIYAFATGRALAPFINGLPGRKVVAAHSLGNMVASAAINDGNMNVAAYYMTDAAVPMEAYGSYGRPSSQGRSDRESPEKAMTHPNFEIYPPRVQSTHWYDLFIEDGESSDPRARLTWKGRFSKVLSSTVLYNYYSSGEEVLENGDGGVPEVDWHLIKPSMGVWAGVKVWVMQEMKKGIPFSIGLTPYNVHGGWGRSNRSTFSMEEEDFFAIHKYSLIGGTFFQKFRLPVHGFFVEDELVSKEVASQYMAQATLLAEAVPALSFAAGSNPLEFSERNRSLNENIDLDSDMRDPAGFWPVRDELHQSLWNRWLHGDLKDVAYVYTFRLFDNWVKNMSNE